MSDDKPLRLNSYYYSFSETGVRLVDELLAAVASAGKRYHHTENWTDNDYGPSCVDEIQDAANRLAIALEARDAREHALREALREIAKDAPKEYDPGVGFTGNVDDEYERGAANQHQWLGRIARAALEGEPAASHNARGDALEEAAKVADRYPGTTATWIAAEIRALKDTP